MRNFRYIVVYILLLPLLGGSLVTDAKSQNREIVRFDHLTPDDGLSQSTVHNILQDSDGYIWFATQDGLNRYDGYGFTTYYHNPDVPGTISYNRISRIYEDREGTLWVGTLGRGLNRYDRDLDQFVHYPVGPERTDAGYYGNNIHDIFEDSFGNFWIGKSNGLFLMDRGSGELVHYTSEPDNPHSLNANGVRTIYEDSNNDLWIGTERGLNRMNREEGTFRRFQADPSDPEALGHPYIYSIHEDSEGTLWIGTRGGGLHRYKSETETFHRYRHIEDDPNSISGNSISDILEDPHGTLWIATENNGLNRFDRNQERFIRFKSEPGNPTGLNTNSLQSLYVSGQNRLWIGTFDGGINTTRLDQPQFEHYKPEFNRPQSLSHPAVLSFGEDSSGALWIGTDGGGLNRFDRENGVFSVYRHIPDNPNSLSSDIILDIFEGPGRQLWLGTYQEGISVLDIENELFTHYRHDPQDPSSLSNNDVWRMYQDRSGTIWIGTIGGGLNRYDPETETFFSYMHDPDDPSTLNNNFVSSIYEDSRGRFWVGSYGGGLSLMNREDGTFTHYTLSNSSISDNYIVTIHEDRNGNLWIATKGWGLNHFDPGTDTFTHFTTSSGMPNHVVNGILEDDSGHLWLSTNNGISRFEPEEQVFTNYNLVHGLQSREFKEGSFFRDSEGYFYFGGINGFNRFHPDSVATNMSVSPVVLTDFRIFNRQVPIGGDSPLQKQISQADEIVLPWDSSVLTFDYAALNFDLNKNNRYSYILEGFDSDWNNVGSQRSATYTNLAPGEYTFEVRAANNDGVWSEQSASIALIITPPFWQTTWFYLLMGLCLTGAVVGGYKYRVRSITNQNRRLEQEVKRQTTELFDKNGELEKTLQELKQTRGELIEKAHKAGMADLATNVLHNVGNILNSVNVSTSLIDEILTRSRLRGLKKANALLRDHQDDLKSFIMNDPKGVKLLEYYLQLEGVIEQEYEDLQKHKNRLSDNVNLIIDVVAAQQTYSQAGRLFESVSLEKVLDDTLTLQAATIERHGLQIIREYSGVGRVEVEKSKLIHTLINILKNAKEAMEEMDPTDKKLILRSFEEEDRVCLSVTDSGEGIEKDKLGRIFTHGFTTKQSGRGFGLHSCANYMQEIGGEIRVESDGPGKGSTFILCFRRPEGKNSTVNRGRPSELLDKDDD